MIEDDQRERLERMGLTQSPNETDHAFHERVMHELHHNQDRLRYGTRDWYARRALAASWWVKTVSVSSPEPHVVLVECWGPAWLPVKVPDFALATVRAAIKPDMPIGLELRVEDGRP